MKFSLNRNLKTNKVNSSVSCQSLKIALIITTFLVAFAIVAQKAESFTDDVQSEAKFRIIEEHLATNKLNRAKKEVENAIKEYKRRIHQEKVNDLFVEAALGEDFLNYKQNFENSLEDYILIIKDADSKYEIFDLN